VRIRGKREGKKTRIQKLGPRPSREQERDVMTSTNHKKKGTPTHEIYEKKGKNITGTVADRRNAHEPLKKGNATGRDKYKLSRFEAPPWVLGKNSRRILGGADLGGPVGMPEDAKIEPSARERSEIMVSGGANTRKEGVALLKIA